MQRPRQHIIETESKKELDSIIPNHWVMRELAPDYGLDFMVEIFKGESSTGNIFYLQLKGSDQVVKNSTISYQLKKEHIEYYNSIQSPILFVIYSTSTKQFWGIWSNKLKDTLSGNFNKQKTYKINFNESHLIDKYFFTNLENTFSIALPKRINISCDYIGEKSSMYHQQLLKWIQYYFGEFIEINNNLLPYSINFTYEETNNSLVVKANSPQKTFNLVPIDITDDTFLYLPILDVNHPPQQLNEALILTSYIFHKHNIKSSIEILTKTIISYAGELFSPIHLFEITKKAVEENLIFDIHNLSKAVIEDNRLDLFQVINISILTLNYDGRLTYIYRNNLLTAIESLEEKSLVATFSYNLANSYRSTQELYLASKYYQNSRKNDPQYLEKSYWWFEYAGILFLSSHYHFSEKFYRKSYALDNESFVPLIYSLLGDSLFFQGKFSEAKSEFNKFLSAESGYPFEEMFLKKQVCENFELLKLDKIDFNIPKSIELTEQAFIEKDSKKWTEAILNYPLNGLAWFNYGVFLKDSNDLENAFTAFLTAVCIHDWDKEAWKNCLFISLNLGKIDNMILIYCVILDKFGVEFINYIADHILKDLALKKEEKIELIKAFSELAAAKKQRETNLLIRL